MVSMVEVSSNSTLNNNDPAMESVATKSEPILEGSVSPSVSTPEVEVEALTQDVAQTQKRKGGRKPVCKIFFYSFVFYATSNPGPRTPLFSLFFPLFNSYTYHFRILLLTHPPYLTLPFVPCHSVFLFFFSPLLFFLKKKK